MRKKTNEIATHTDNKELSSHPIKTHVRRRENKQVLQIIIISELTFPKQSTQHTRYTQSPKVWTNTTHNAPPRFSRSPSAGSNKM